MIRPCDLFFFFFPSAYSPSLPKVIVFYLKATLSMAFAWLHFLHQTLEAILWCDTWHKWQKSVSRPISNTQFTLSSSSSRAIQSVSQFKLHLATEIIFTLTFSLSLQLSSIIDHVSVSICTLLLIIVIWFTVESLKLPLTKFIHFTVNLIYLLTLPLTFTPPLSLSLSIY